MHTVINVVGHQYGVKVWFQLVQHTTYSYYGTLDYAMNVNVYVL